MSVQQKLDKDILFVNLPSNTGSRRVELWALDQLRRTKSMDYELTVLTPLSEVVRRGQHEQTRNQGPGNKCSVVPDDSVSVMAERRYLQQLAVPQNGKSETKPNRTRSWLEQEQSGAKQVQAQKQAAVSKQPAVVIASQNNITNAPVKTKKPAALKDATNIEKKIRNDDLREKKAKPQSQNRQVDNGINEKTKRTKRILKLKSSPDFGYKQTDQIDMYRYQQLQLQSPRVEEYRNKTQGASRNVYDSVLDDIFESDLDNLAIKNKKMVYSPSNVKHNDCVPPDFSWVGSIEYEFPILFKQKRR
ncbi:hypothetical protein MIR68_003805 [Amoeboaphelidium protococcarum]|nr:hypothetical protein MIR68_003805 [Amoeboaphelidium protococcarum]